MSSGAQVYTNTIALHSTLDSRARPTHRNAKRVKMYGIEKHEQHWHFVYFVVRLNMIHIFISAVCRTIYRLLNSCPTTIQKSHNSNDLYSLNCVVGAVVVLLYTTSFTLSLAFALLAQSQSISVSVSPSWLRQSRYSIRRIHARTPLTHTDAHIQPSSSSTPSVEFCYFKSRMFDVLNAH